MTINLEKLLDLTIAAKLDPKFLDDIHHLITAEMEAEISKKTGKKNQYGAILKFITHTKKVHKDKPRESFYGIFKGKDDRWYITDGFGAVRFNNLEDTKDIPIIENDLDLLSIITEFKKKCVIEVSLPGEKDLILSYKNQKAEKNNSNDDYSIYYKVGSRYYNPDELNYFYSMMGENLKGFESNEKRGALFITDDDGNQAVLMQLDIEAKHIRETES
jgi:hypothetical protein